LKSVLSELEVLTQKSSMRLDEVTQLVQVDQGMSLRVLRMANSGLLCAVGTDPRCAGPPFFISG